MIDVAAMLVSAEKLGIPLDEESIFDLLNKKNILDKRIYEKAKNIGTFFVKNLM